MNLTFSVDERIVAQARKVAQSMGKSLNQLVREYLEQLTRQRDVEEDIAELHRLTVEGQGRSAGWKFDRDELHERA